MGMKYNILKDLVSKKINVHLFEEITTLEHLIKYAQLNEKFSIRFDRDKDYHQLPFYKYDQKDYLDINERDKYFKKIITEMNNLNCSLVCANGYLYDDVQICNFVIKIDGHGDFILEFSTKKVSLREMYEYETSIIKGNISDNIKDMDWLTKSSNPINDENIEKILSWAFKLNVINRNIEATLYEQKVGILKEYITCWQID